MGRPSKTGDVTLLAIDLGLRFGWAAFESTGRLSSYGSHHVGNRSVLRKAVPGFLDGFPCLRTLVIEGGGDLSAHWEKEARRRGLVVRSVMGETWRKTLMPSRKRRTGKNAKAAADGLARKVIRDSGAKRPTSLRHDAAEAILIGLWASSKRPL